jgi:hypothetical protein
MTTGRTCERIVTGELWLSIFYFESWRFVTDESFMHERSSLHRWTRDTLWAAVCAAMEANARDVSHSVARSIRCSESVR